MLKFFFIEIFLNIKFIEIFKLFLLSFNFFSLKHFFLTIHKMNRLRSNRFNTIIDFLIDIENYNIIILLKLNSDDELIKINTI